MTVRPPRRVTRTIFFGPIEGFRSEHGAEDADHEVEHIILQPGQICCIAFLEPDVRLAGPTSRV